MQTSPNAPGQRNPASTGASAPGFCAFDVDFDYQYSVGSDPSILRAFSRVHFSQRYSRPRSLVATLHVSGATCSVRYQSSHDSFIGPPGSGAPRRRAQGATAAALP